VTYDLPQGSSTHSAGIRPHLEDVQRDEPSQ